MQLLALILLIPSFSMAELKYPSDRLKVMDIETLQRIVAKNLNSAQRAVSDKVVNEDGFVDDSPVSELTREEGANLIKQSLELVFARPEQDRATSGVYSNIEGVAVDYGGIYQFLEQITNQAIDTLDKTGKEASLLRDQNSYVYILNNMMAELKPLALKPEGVKFHDLIKKIRDEDIDFSDALKSYRILNSMSNVTNPSKVAETIVGKKKCSWWAFLWC